MQLVYSCLSTHWFFLVFTNLKANFLHNRNEYIIGFIYHGHLAKRLPRVHHAMFRCKPLASFLFSWGHPHLLVSHSHDMQTPTLLTPTMSVISLTSLDRNLGIIKYPSSLGLRIYLLRGRREKRHHCPWLCTWNFSNPLSAAVGLT